jgi:uncharacterized membrane protein YccC
MSADLLTPEHDRMRHVRLDETSAVATQGQPLYDRISWLMELLSAECGELRGKNQAFEHEVEAHRHELGASENRRMAAEYRARNFERQLAASEAARQQLLDTLTAARDLLVGCQKQAGYLPQQGGYATALTEAEMTLARGIASLDDILTGASR